jgi:hypothetical protein
MTNCVQWSKLGLGHMVRFLGGIKSLNRFDICVIYLRLIIFSVSRDVLVDTDVPLMSDFVNLKIKLI